MTTDTRTTDAEGADLLAVHLVTLGCTRNDVDSEELAGRLEAGGFRLVDDPEDADTVMVNTCGFIEAAKKDSVDTLLAAAEEKADGRARAVVAVGCMAERYGTELATALPEADAVLGFDDYPDIAAKLQSILAGEKHQPHVPRDRRTLLPIAPAERGSAAAAVAVPGHGGFDRLNQRAEGLNQRAEGLDQRGGGTDAADLPPGLAPASGPRTVRRRLSGAPWAPLKLASGCDRRCTFCAIPTFRGAYLSRPPAEVVAEAGWLAERGVREAFLVSENSSSYGKDLGDIRLLESLLGDLAGVDGLDWIRVSYLQPAEMRPGLVQAMVDTPKVVPYFDLSFQHAAPGVLRRMRRFGDPESFLALIDSIRALVPDAGIRSNVICGFPGESEDDLAMMCEFLAAARLDAIGVFGYSDEEGTEALNLDQKVDADEIEARRAHTADLADELVSQRAEERVGARVSVLVEEEDPDLGWVGRAAHQGPEVDGCTRIDAGTCAVGDLVEATVVATEGVDLIATVDGNPGDGAG